MSEIKAVKRLRGLAKEVVDMRWGVEFDRAIDALEAEVADRFMELPVDADGVPIHIGDTLEHVPGGWAFTADMLEIDRWGVHVRMNGQSRIPCECCRHVKPRTIEDVLRDCCNEWNEHLGDDWEHGVYAKYADELRELMGGAE